MNVRGDFKHEFRKPFLKDSDVTAIGVKVNSILIPRDVSQKLVEKLMMSESLAAEYILEYKRFIVMAACGRYMVSPSEQVDHVWHLHQLCTREYREFSIEIFGTLFKH